MLKRTIQAIALSATLVAAFAHSPLWAQAAFQGEGGKVRVLSFASGNDYPFRVIAKMGFDKKHGFELENVPIQPGGAVMTAFRSGATEGGLMNWLEAARARTNGDQVSAVVPFLEMPNVWVVPKESSAKDVAGLKGKKVGTYNRFSPEWVLYLAAARAKAGYDPKTDSTIQEAGPGLLRGLLDQKQIEAAFIFYNLALPMVATGEYRVLFTSRDLLQSMGIPKETMLTSVAFRDDYIKSNPKNVKAFVLAYKEAVAYLNKNDDIWVEVLAPQGITDPAVVKLMRDFSREVTMDRFSANPMAETKSLFDALYAVGGKEATGIDALPEGIFNTSVSK
jgi:ABC-type nitrate/sulfonate/bicarbonate transport system substrate-binding protein